VSSVTTEVVRHVWLKHGRGNRKAVSGFRRVALHSPTDGRGKELLFPFTVPFFAKSFIPFLQVP
jgi:hypothetical protein